MRAVAARTPRVSPGDDLDVLLTASVPPLAERSVVAVTSKIVGLCEGNVAEITREKAELVRAHAQRILDPSYSQHGVALTMVEGILIPSAGIDESNAAGGFVMWPERPLASARRIRELLRRRDGVRELGVVITDSTTQPLRRGVTGVAVAHTGFHGVRSYVGIEDLFGRVMHVSEANVADSLAATAVFVMGEGSESTPLAIIDELENVEFSEDADPYDVRMPWDDDLYRPLLEALPWEDGGQAAPAPAEVSGARD